MPTLPISLQCGMTVIFKDVHMWAEMKVFPMALDHFIDRELLYADDTLILGHRAREVNIFLDLIVKESKRYNLKLNKIKCKHIDINCKPDIHVENGENGTITKRKIPGRNPNKRCLKTSRTL